MPRQRVEDERLDPYEFRLMCWLASHGDQYTEHASVREAARRLGMSVGKVSKAIPHLAELGLIEVESSGAGSRLSIVVDMDAWEAESPTAKCSPHEHHRSRHEQECSPHEHLSDSLHIPGEQQGEQQLERARNVVAVDRRERAGDAARMRNEELFERFWRAYPRKVGKPAARRAFMAMCKANVDLRVVSAGLHAWMAYWAERGQPDYIPHPSTWLNQHRWNDSPPVASTPVAPLTVMQRAWMRANPGATEADARAHSELVRAQSAAIDVLVT